MKKALAILLSIILFISCFGCNQSQQQINGIKAYNGYFDISAEDFLVKLNEQIKGNKDKYPQLPNYTDKKQSNYITDYYSQFDNGASLRVTENNSHKIVEVTLLLDITKSTKSGANNCGYYFGKIGLTIDPNMKDAFKSIKTTNLAVNDVQTTSEDNLFCVAVNEDGISQYRIYPLAKNQ